MSRSSSQQHQSICATGFERLSGIALERMGQNARSGALFVFFGKRRTSVKILFADRTGLCLFYKRLDRATFRIPDALSPDSTHVTITERAQTPRTLA